MKLFFQYMVTQYTFNTNQILVYHPISRLIHSELIIQNCYINLAFRFVTGTYYMTSIVISKCPICCYQNTW